MKVYAYDPAPNPQRLALFMKMKGLELETIPVDMTTGEHLGDAYKQINPAGTLPALVLDDGTVLTEVVGMYTYLEDLHPASLGSGRHRIRILHGRRGHASWRCAARGTARPRRRSGSHRSRALRPRRRPDLAAAP